MVRWWCVHGCVEAEVVGKDGETRFVDELAVLLLWCACFCDRHSSWSVSHGRGELLHLHLLLLLLQLQLVLLLPHDDLLQHLLCRTLRVNDFRERGAQGRNGFCEFAHLEFELAEALFVVFDSLL